MTLLEIIRGRRDDRMGWRTIHDAVTGRPPRDRMETVENKVGAMADILEKQCLLSTLKGVDPVSGAPVDEIHYPMPTSLYHRVRALETENRRLRRAMRVIAEHLGMDAEAICYPTQIPAPESD